MLAVHMELRHLRYFVAVAEEENVSRAALKLRVSQPALSRQIRDLEEELGFPLLERSARSVRLLETGRAFLAEARAVLQRADQAVEAARAVAASKRSELHVGYAPSLTARILPPTLRAFQGEAPAARVILHDLSTEEMFAGLRSAKLQIAFMVRPPQAMLRGIRFEELAREPWRLAVAPRHPFARRRNVTMAEIAPQRFIGYSRAEYPDYHEHLAEIFGHANIKVRISEEHDSVSSLIAAVESGSGIALVTESIACVAGPRVKLQVLAPAPDPLVIGAAWPKAALSESGETFLKFARETAARAR